MVKMIVGPRAFPFEGRTKPVGAVIEVSEATAARMESSKPPFGRRTRVDMDVTHDPWKDFTDAAQSLLEDKGVAPTAYDGERTDAGRVNKSHVDDWLRAHDAPDA